MSETVEAASKAIAGWLSRAPDMLRANAGIDREDVAAVHGGLRALQYAAADRLAAESRVMGDIESGNDWLVLKSEIAKEDGAMAAGPVELMHAKGLTLVHEGLWQALAHYGPAVFPSRYAIWRFAVQCETALGDELVNLSACTRSQDARDRALVLTRKAHARAAAYRVRRRVAYHLERSHIHSIALPAQNRIQTFGDLMHAAGAIEAWFMALLLAQKENVDGIDPAIALTGEAMAMCEQQVSGGTTPARLGKAIKRLSVQAEAIKPDAMAADEAALLITSEAERIFDYYDSLFGAADERDVFDAAQYLSRIAVRRLRVLRRVGQTHSSRAVA